MLNLIKDLEAVFFNIKKLLINENVYIFKLCQLHSKHLNYGKIKERSG